MMLRYGTLLRVPLFGAHVVASTSLRWNSYEGLTYLDVYLDPVKDLTVFRPRPAPRDEPFFRIEKDDTKWR